MSDRLAELSAAGVAVWLDDLSRTRLESGNLHDLVRDRGVVGVTTNQAIFQKAITGNDVYDSHLRDLAVRGVTVDEAVRMITSADVRDDAAVGAAVAETAKRFGRIDVLFNNAGICAYARVHDMT